MGAKCLDADGQWNTPLPGSSDPSTQEKKLEPLKERVVPGRCHQICLLLNREGRLLSIKDFLVVISALFIASALLNNLGKCKYTYDGLYPKFGNGFTLMNLFISVFARRRFGDYHLNFFRECKTGISSTAYWFSKQLHQFVFSAAWMAAWVFPFYYACVPMQKFGNYLWMGLWLTWYWCGFANMFSCMFGAAQQTSVLLVLIFWVMLEGLFSGVHDLMRPGDNGFVWFLSSMTAGRWSTQGLYAMELHELPKHVLKFDDVIKKMKDMDIYDQRNDLEGAVNQAVLALFMLGMIFRLINLLLLALVKYAQGDGFIRDMLFVISSFFKETCGCGGAVGFSQYDSNDVKISAFERGEEGIKITMGSDAKLAQ